MNALEPLFPALHKLEPLGLPSGAFSTWFAYANQAQAARLAHHLEREFSLIGLECPEAVDRDYLRSDAFRANVVQAVRAAEVAESDEKLRLTARTLAGCILNFPAPAVDKFQCLRLVEHLSEREGVALTWVLASLDSVEPFTADMPVGGVLPGFSRDEAHAALLGLMHLGFLERCSVARDGWHAQAQAVQDVWRCTPLARQWGRLSRLVVTHDF